MTKWVERAEKEETTYRLTPGAEVLGADVKYFVIDSAGRMWAIAYISKRGRLHLAKAIPDNIGLDVDEEGRIKVEGK